MPLDSVDVSPVRILAFGELLWDMLPSGKKLGGAPVNFLYHAKTLGADVRALTRVGADPLGDEILASLDALGVPRDMIQISRTAPTGTVDVKLDSNGSPTYAIVQNVAWDEIEVDESVLEQTIRFLTGSRELSAFYYGSLALRSSENRAGIERIFEALPNGVARVCDLNLRAPFYDKRTIEFALNNANVFKLNDVEAVVLDEMFSDRAPRALADLADGNGSLGAALRADLPSAQRLVANWASNLLAEFNLQSLVVTCGEEGAFLFDREGFDRAPSPKVAVKDTVGAGDSFSAVCVVGLLMGRSREQILEEAARRAAYVCSQDGGTPPIPDELTRPFMG